MRLGANEMTGLTIRRLPTALAAALLLAALPSISQAQTRRVAHTATLLPSGDLLIAGGVNDAGVTLNSSDLFAASRGNFIVATPDPTMTIARASHTATLMSNGCVLVAGGNASANDTSAAGTLTAEIYNPTTGGWTATGGMTTARYNHTASLLNDGRVLVCGGQDNAGAAIDSCEYYTPTSCTAGAFTVDTPLQQARYNHTATVLKDGKIWFAGGANPANVATNGFLPTTERYVPNPAGAGLGTFQSASPLIVARAYHTATLMGDGKALVIGGYNRRDVLANRGITESAEIYDPIGNSMTPAAAMSTRRQSHAAVLAASGDVTVFGGLGNITTTYVLGTSLNNAVANTLLSVSTLTATKTATPGLATITGLTGLLNLDFLLNKPVVGQISDGEMWISSPSVMTSWGAVRFTPASETVPAVGLRINLAGTQVACRVPVGAGNVANNCGNIQKQEPVPAALSQMQGSVVFYRRTGVTLGGNPTVSAPSSLTTDATINSSNINANVTGGNFRATVRVSMDDAFLTKMINSATFTLTSATLVQPSSFTATLTGGTGVINNITVTADPGGAAEAVVTINFTNVVGAVAFTGEAGQSIPAGAVAIPMAGAQMTADGGLANMDYTMDGANLTGQTFLVDVATVIVRKMIFADAETYNPKTNSWVLAPPPGIEVADQRYGHSATLMPNNDKVFFGGRACIGAAACGTQTATAVTGFQLLSYEKNFAATAGLAAQARAFHTSTLLPGGDILVAGGTNGPSILRHAELFTPGTDLFSPVNGVMRYVRDLHTATLMPNGRVLIAGGFTTNATSTGSTNTAEIYYPDMKRFIETSPMISSRSNHSAIMLPDGRIFVAGGFGAGDVITGTAEIFITTESRWIAAATMPAGCQRAIHATVQLKDGRVMLVGGVNASGPMDTTAFYDPTANTWACSLAGEMPTPLRSHSATLLFDGRVLVAGGNDGFGEANKSYFFSPPASPATAGVWTATDGSPFLEPRFNHTATLLPNGTVMISGGSQSGGAVPRSIEIFHVNASSWVTGGIGTSGQQFGAGARAYHTMTLALNNKVYAIGGSDGVVGGVGVSLYTAAEAGYFTSTPDSISKDAPPSFRQSTITDSYPTPFLPAANLAVNGTRFRGGTEASGGGAASANSAFSYPHMVLQQVDGSGGAASQSNGGFAVDLTTEIFQNAGNLATLDSSLTVPLPATTAKLPYGWYSLRMGANDVYSDAKMLQVGPLKPVTAPSGITGIAAGISSMTWSWNSIGGVDGYNVYNATTGIFISSIPTTLLTRATFYQTGLNPSATSSIFVAAYTLSGDGPLTASPTSYTLSTTPVSVTIASVTFSDLLLYWGFNGNVETGATYEVTQSSDNFLSGISTPVPRLFNLTTNFTIIPNLLSNTTYFFRVQAFNLAGEASPYSAIVSTRTRAPVTQPIVTGRTSTSIDWGWADPGGVTNYRVYNATSGVLLAAPVLNSFSEVGLGTNTEHSIRVSAITNAGEGPLSPSASAYTSAASPGPFIPPISALTTGSFLINWTNNANPLQTFYTTSITEYASDGSAVSVSSADAADLSFTQGYGNLIPSTLYRYEIIAYNGEDLPSDTPAAVFGTTYTLPTAPSALTVIDTTPTDILVSWGTNNNSSTATYQVTYSSDNFTLFIATAVFFSQKFGGNTATIGGLVTGATYSVRVIASNPFGQLSQFSNTVTTRTFNGGGPAGSVQGPLLVASDSSFSGSIGNGRKIVIRAPANAFPSDVLVNIAPAVGVSSNPCSTGTKDLSFLIVPTPALQPTGSLYFTFDYTAADLGRIEVNRALLLRYDPGSGACVPLETIIDTASRQMTARINHFSLFQVGTVPLATTADSARIFPNPYYTGRDGYLTIDNVPPLARVRILTLRGEQVLDVRANNNGLLTWSGTNGSGRAVASGVYLVMVEAGSSKKILKLAVIR